MADGSAAKVSIVTPAYNAEPYLAQCIESVLAQTYPHWDYTIVNNCSTDGTLAIAERYAAVCPRIRVVTNETFVGIMANHNRAARQAAADSKYCKFVLADDWLFPDCLQHMVALAEAHPTVGVVGAYGLRGDKVSWDGLPHSAVVVDGRQLCRERLLLNIPHVFGSPTSVMLRADLLRTRTEPFDESSIHSDTDLCFDLLRDSDFGFVHQVLSFTRTQPNSTSTFSRRMNTFLPAIMRRTQKYGALYLTPGECQAVLDHHLAEYYDYLISLALHDFNWEAWTYHMRALAVLGVPFDRWRFGKGIAARVLRAIGNPQQTLTAMYRRVRG